MSMPVIRTSIFVRSTRIGQLLIRLCRNLEKFEIPAKTKAEKKPTFFNWQVKQLQSPGLVKPYILKADQISPGEKEFLIEHFLLSEGFQEAGAGSAFGLDETGEAIVIFNIKEHLQLQSTDCTGDIEKAWAKVVAIESQLATDVNFAFSSKFGF